MTVRTVAMLTAGGLAPCLSSAVGGLIQRYTELAPDVRIIAYTNGYAGLLRGDSIEVTPQVRERAHLLHRFGGSPIGNSRVKLTNVADCVKRGLVQEGQDPLHVAAEQLTADGVDVLHTIGGDDTNTTAADLAAYLHENEYELTVVGLPKTVDNDVVPIRQSLGAWTAAELLGRHFQRILPRLDEPALDAILDVGELDPAVADRAATECVQPPGIGANLVRDLDRFSRQQSGIAVEIGDDPHPGRNRGVALDQPGDGRRQARREAPGGKHGNGTNGHTAYLAVSAPHPPAGFDATRGRPSPRRESRPRRRATAPRSRRWQSTPA